MSSATTDVGFGAGPIRRLPVNHRRRKVPLELRKRTVKACNFCNVRRVKCSGEQPCSRCATSSRICEYPPEIEKIIIQKETYEELQKRCLTLQQCLADAVPAEKNREALLSKWTKASSAPVNPLRMPQPRLEEEEEQQTGDGRILQDPDGYTRYLGESSGAAFMDRLREFVGTIIPLLSATEGMSSTNMEAMFTSLLGHYHTHDSRPLLLPHVDPFFLPSSEDISKLISNFRFYAGDGAGAGTAPCGGIYYWGDLWDLEQRASNILPLNGSRDESILLCKLNAVMALACQYDPSLALPWDSHPGETYFARAKLLLINPMEDASLAYMCALSLMGHYLLGLHRRDAAYMYIGLAARVAVIHGLHRGWMIGNPTKSAEQHKREFWNTFIMDRWLACLMGRPVMLPDEAITIEEPLDMVDVDLPPAIGLRAHIKLSMIMSEIANTFYGTSVIRVGYPQVLSRVDVVLDKLSAWHAELPLELKLQEEDKTPERGRLTLHMLHKQLIILCTRPMLFQAVKQAVAVKYISRGQKRHSSPSLSHIKCCADAARSITSLTRRLLSSNQTAFLASIEYHFPFTAAIVLELARLLPTVHHLDDGDNIRLLVDYLQQSGDKGNESAADCRDMVIEFGAIVTRLLLDDQMQQVKSSPSVITTALTSIPQMNPFGNDFSPSSPQVMLSNGMSLDVGLLGQGQAAAYEQLFSWFSP